ncbi:MAG: N-acetyltransferase [Rhodothermaceae bacterium]|nr:N-acetyltransferase [Rhodothermaceae bacterium]
MLRFTLNDGTPVGLRPIVPADRDRLLHGFEALSDESRRFRFLGSLSALHEDQLRYLTEVDHRDHVAWGALSLEDPEAPGFGIARFIRLSEHPHLAEFSLTVIDTAQGHGLGGLLLATLYVLAPTVGIDTLRGVVARDNDRMTTWMHRLGAVVVADDPGELVFDLPVHTDLDELPASSVSFRTLVEQVRQQFASGADQPQNET